MQLLNQKMGALHLTEVMLYLKERFAGLTMIVEQLKKDCAAVTRRPDTEVRANAYSTEQFE